ncbi:MAG TPA: hypothetical protein PKA55_14330 [Rhodoblastus sp.]|nr:hypothetical protein [Rhodoblastus sp.]
MAKILAFRPRRPEPALRAARVTTPIHFPELMKQLTARLDWSEATAEDEYGAALAAFDIVCGRPASRRSRAA